MLRLTQQNAYSMMPARVAIPSGRDFLRRPVSYAAPLQLYYEILDMPLEEVEKLKALRVRLVKANTELVRNLTVRLPPTATVTDLLDKARPRFSRRLTACMPTRRLRCSTRHNPYPKAPGCVAATLTSLAQWVSLGRTCQGPHRI